jgi:hypothetical protein
MFLSPLSPDKAIEQVATEIADTEAKLRAAHQRRQALLEGTGQPRSVSRTNPGQRETVDMALLEIGGYIANSELTLKRLYTKLTLLKKERTPQRTWPAASHFPLLDQHTFQSCEVVPEFEQVAFLKVNERQRFILLIWQQFVQDEQHQAVMKAAIQALRRYHANKLLIDARHHQGMGQKDALWTKVSFAPEAYQAGLRYLALVLPDSAILRASVDLLDEQIRSEQSEIYTALSFVSIETALSWLLSQEHTIVVAK